MDIIITINCDNAAFQEDREGYAQEVPRILKELGSYLRSCPLEDTTLTDCNGNAVGKFKVIED